MSRPAGEPLTRITINLLTTDVEWLKARYPTYQLRIRKWIHDQCEAIRDQEGEETLLALQRMYPDE